VSRFHDIAHKHFPLAPIEGDGCWALISLCESVARISLFDLTSARQATADLWAAYGCGAQQCTRKHGQRTVRLQAPVPAGRDSFCWEKD